MCVGNWLQLMTPFQFTNCTWLTLMPRGTSEKTQSQPRRRILWVREKTRRFFKSLIQILQDSSKRMCWTCNLICKTPGIWRKSIQDLFVWVLVLLIWANILLFLTPGVQHNLKNNTFKGTRLRDKKGKGKNKQHCPCPWG